MLIRYFFLYLWGKLNKLLGRSRYYETKYGVKMLNRPRAKRSAAPPAEPFLCSVSELYLGVDGLCDEYTHCGKPVAGSPHAGLIRTVMDGGPIAKSEYVRLERRGALDGRDAFWRPASFHEKITRARIDELQKSGTAEPGEAINLYAVRGKYYIADGKHRAALYAVSGIDRVPVRVQPLSAETLAYMRGMLTMMEKSGKQYEVNEALLRAILEDNQEENR